MSESNVSYVTNNEKVELETQEEDETKIEALEERERRVMSELEKKLKRRKKSEVYKEKCKFRRHEKQ